MAINLKFHNEETYDKIEENNLSVPKKISLEEKIQIFERFLQTGEELIGSTIFEGYPVGKWAIQIRNIVKRINKGELKNQTFTKDIIGKLGDLGILERQKGLTIDEQIDSLIEWRKKYPNATLIYSVSNEILSEYVKTEEELKQLNKEYKKVQNYYKYIRVRKSRGKLSEEQLEKCKNGNIGGVFARITESELDKLMKEYDMDEETINLIKEKYGSIFEFRRIYINAVMKHNVCEIIPRKILNNVKLFSGFDLSSPDLIARNRGFVDLINDISHKSNFFINYNELEEKFIELIKEDGFKGQILVMYYGLNGGEKLSKAEIARKVDRTPSRVQQLVFKFIRVFGNSEKMQQLDLENEIINIDYDFEKKIIEEYFKNFDIFISKEPKSIDQDIKDKLINMLKEGIEKTKKRREQIEIIKKMPIEQQHEILKAQFGEKINSLDFSILPPWHDLYKKYNGIEINENSYICNDIYKECVDSEYSQSKIAEFMVNIFDIELIDKKVEIEKIIASNIYFSEEKKAELKKILDKKMSIALEEKKHIEEERLCAKIMEDIDTLMRTPIKELNLSVRSFNCLIMDEINTVQDLFEKSENDLMRIKKFGTKSYNEVIETMKALKIEMVDGHFVCNLYGIDSEENRKKMMDLEEEINSNKYINEEKKKELIKLLYETFKVKEYDNQEISSNLENIESIESLEEISKDELIKHILEQQKIIENQCDKINKLSLSLQKKEDV